MPKIGRCSGKIRFLLEKTPLRGTPTRKSELGCQKTLGCPLDSQNPPKIQTNEIFGFRGKGGKFPPIPPSWAPRGPVPLFPSVGPYPLRGGREARDRLETAWRPPGGPPGGQGRPTKEFLQIFLSLGLSFQPIRLRNKMVVSPSEMSK